MSSPTDFPPLPSSLGVNHAFISNQPVTLVMKEQFSLSGDDFSVKTVTGQEVVRCNGKAMSLSGRKEFFNTAGQHLFSLRKEHLSFPKSWYLEGPGGEKFVIIAGRFSIGKAKMDVTFKNMVAGGGDVKLEIRGQFFDRSCDITWDGRPVAKIRRDFFNLAELIGSRQTYGLAVAPGVDAALMAACCIAMDEQRNEK